MQHGQFAPPTLAHTGVPHTCSHQDPGLYTRCAEFFMQHGQFGKAVKMLIAAQQYTRALEMCIEQDVTISEVGGGGEDRGVLEGGGGRRAKGTAARLRYCPRCMHTLPPLPPSPRTFSSCRRWPRP